MAPGSWKRALSRFTASDAELDAVDLARDSREHGAVPVVDCCTGERVAVSGTVRALTLRPRGGVPALEAELYDGSGALTLVWLGRRRILGIDPGRRLTAHGRVTEQQGRPTMYNPSYELHP
jgi:RecG-like helicase